MIPFLRPARIRRAIVSWLVLFALAANWLSATPAIFDRQISRQPVELGVELISVRQFDERGWLNFFVLEIDTAQPHLSFDALLGHERLTSPENLSAIAARRRAIAGINGDFFHIQSSQAPLGIHLQSGELFKSPAPGRELAIGFSPNPAEIFLGKISFQGEIATRENAVFPLSGWNVPAVPENAIVFYNRRWAETAPGNASPDMSGWTGLLHAVLDNRGQVLALLPDSPGPEIPADGSVLLGRGHGAKWLQKHAPPGAILQIRHDLSPANLQTAIGGSPVILRDGNPVHPPGGDIHPRTAIGFNKDRSRVWLLVVDGRSPLSRGATFYDLAILLQELGATDALNLDGGGSSTLVARPPGTKTPLLQNRPSDGNERSIPNGLGLFSNSSTGSMSQLFIQPPTPAGLQPIVSREIRLAPGAIFRPNIAVTDAHINPVDLPPKSLQWQVDPPHLGTFSDGVFRAQTPGRGRLIATAKTENDTISSSLPIHIVGEPVSLEIEPSELSLSANQSIPISVRAVDAFGYRAPLASEDLQWEIRGNAGTFRDGIFFSGEKAGAGSLTAKFGDLSVTTPIGVGTEPALLAAFDDLSRWTSNAVPEQATAELSSVNHKPFTRDRAQAAKLAYDFTGATRTRAAYLRPAQGPMPLPGRPLRLGLWVYGDAREAWLRAQIADAAGVPRPIDFARNIDWTGWRYLEAEIPPGTDYPISLRAIYVVEPRTDAQYKGTVYFDELLAVHAPEIDPSLIPETPLLQDPANRPAEIDPHRDDHFRFIVFGDSKVEAANPNSSGAKIFDALIDRINRERNIEFVLFTGDLIETDTDANYRFGKQFLDRLAFPYHFSIANHEIAGTDNFDRYREFFGDTYFAFRHANSEFLILNTARPDGLRASEPEQWPWLREKLENSTAQNLFFMTHTPVVDPMPGGKTGWTDPAEVELFQRLLTETAERGKNVYAFHGHVHGFNRRIYDGVQYLVSAGAGSPLYLPPAKGGFFHYAIVTVKGDEVTYQVIPLIEKIELPETIRLAPGETADLTPIATSPENLVRFPLRYPAAVAWTLSDPTLARIDPATAQITALASGETVATIKSGDQTATTRIIIE